MTAAALTVGNLKEQPAEEGQHGGKVPGWRAGDHDGDKILSTVSVFVKEQQKQSQLNPEYFDYFSLFLSELREMMQNRGL